MMLDADFLTDLAAGAVFGLLVLLPFLKSSVRTLAENGYLALAMMLMIYVGAHLAASDMTRLLTETGLAVLVLLAARLSRSAWPAGIGVLVLAHAGYDFLFGHDAGVADWYPAVCVGFDLVVGTGLIVLILKKQTQPGGE